MWSEGCRRSVFRVRVGTSCGVGLRGPTSLKATKGILRFRFALKWPAIRSFLQGSEEWRSYQENIA